MGNRDDYRGQGGGWRRDDERERRGSGEGRSFDQAGRFNSDEARYGRGTRGGDHGEGEPWRRDRYGARYDQDRTNYGAGYDRQSGEYGRGGSGGGPRGYGGQEYGIEARRDRSGQDRGRQQGGGEQRESWRPHGAAPYGDLEFNARASGVEEFGAPHDYAYHPHQEFDADYLHWRDEQLRSHDRDYDEWRKHQHRQYDDDYRRFRSERRDHFGKNFHEWRSQQNMTTGMQSQQVVPGQTDYAGQQAGFGKGDDQPSGKLEPSPLGGGSGGQTAQTGSQGGSEFGREPSEVQAVTDGSSGRRTDEGGEGRTEEPRH